MPEGFRIVDPPWFAGSPNLFFGPPNLVNLGNDCYDRQLVSFITVRAACFTQIRKLLAAIKLTNINNRS